MEPTLAAPSITFSFTFYDGRADLWVVSGCLDEHHHRRTSFGTLGLCAHADGQYARGDRSGEMAEPGMAGSENGQRVETTPKGFGGCWQRGTKGKLDAKERRINRHDCRALLIFHLGMAPRRHCPLSRLVGVSESSALRRAGHGPRRHLVWLVFVFELGWAVLGPIPKDSPGKPEGKEDEHNDIRCQGDMGTVEGAINEPVETNSRPQKGEHVVLRPSGEK